MVNIKIFNLLKVGFLIEKSVSQNNGLVLLF